MQDIDLYELDCDSSFEAASTFTQFFAFTQVSDSNYQYLRFNSLALTPSSTALFSYAFQGLLFHLISLTFFS